MTNTDQRATWDYHDATKHSLASLRANRHTLEWEIQPLPYKLYRGLDSIALPRDWSPLTPPALDAMAGGAADRERGPHGGPPAPVAPASGPATVTAGRSAAPTLTTLARWLLLSAGITRRIAYANGREMYFRAAACTGALYHIDVYLVCGALPGLEAGVYHFGPHDFALRRLRAGDYRALVVAATGGEPAIAAAPVVAVYSSTFWRNAWKYQARTYRHCFWDCGTILANALAVAAADGLPVRLVLGFVDQIIADLLGLDGEREAALALAAVGHDPGAHPPSAPDAPPLALATEPLSTREVDYPAIRAMHAASSLTSPDEVRAWRVSAQEARPPAGAEPAAGTALAAGAASAAVTLRPLDDLPTAGIESVIRRRGSTRQFTHAAIDFRALSTLLDRSAAAIPADFLAGPDAALTECYLIVNAVDGLAPGTYAFAPARRGLELLREENLRREAGFLGLGQELPADASTDVYWLADLRSALARFGNRGYRAAQLEAAIRGGRLYLGAYALRLGATGLTFFDDDVIALFSPHAAGKSVMFLAAVGRGPTTRKEEGTR